MVRSVPLYRVLDVVQLFKSSRRSLTLSRCTPAWTVEPFAAGDAWQCYRQRCAGGAAGGSVRRSYPPLISTKGLVIPAPDPADSPRFVVSSRGVVNSDPPGGGCSCPHRAVTHLKGVTPTHQGERTKLRSGILNG